MIPLVEFLQSLKSDKFTKLLEEKFPQYVCYAETNTDNQLPQWSSSVVICGTKNWTKLQKDAEFFKFCRKYQWIPTFAPYCPQEMYKNGTNVILILEPILSRNKTHLDYCYHLTHIENYEKIGKTGLKCYGMTNMQLGRTDRFIKSDDTINNEHTEGRYLKKKHYRVILPKIFVVGSNDKEKVLNIFDQIANYSERNMWVVLKIDLHDHKNIEVYKDTANPDDSEAYYLLNDIPSSLITVDKELTKFIREKKYE